MTQSRLDTTPAAFYSSAYLASSPILPKRQRPVPSATDLSDSDQVLWEIFGTLFNVPVLLTADRLGLFAILDQRARSLDEMASALKVEPRVARGLVSLLASLKLLVVQDGCFAPSAAARRFLVPTSPEYWGPMLRRVASLNVTADMLTSAARRGQATVYGEGKSMWRHHEHDREAARGFATAAHVRAWQTARSVARSGALDKVRSLLDVGGGLGTYTLAFAKSNPQLNALVVDTPQVCELANEFLKEKGVADRVWANPCDFLRDPLPASHDAVWLSDILHDWPPNVCLQLLRNAHQALEPGGRIFINELILDEDLAGPPTTATYGVAMLLATAGQQYTLSELLDMLRHAGFSQLRAVGQFGAHTLLSASKGRR